MPEIARFFGIIITMYYDDHNPPHFHARYGSDHASIEITSLQILEGKLPHRALGLIIEWASQHQDELMTNWDTAKNNKQPRKIQPLQ